MKKCLCIILALLMTAGCFSAFAEAPEQLQIDIDLTEMDETMAYERLVGILRRSNAYIGQIIRISGVLELYYDEATDTLYTSCMISDPSRPGSSEIMEFVWDDAPEDRDDYPSFGTELTVTGRFETYWEDGVLFAHLVDTKVEWFQARTYLA